MIAGPLRNARIQRKNLALTYPKTPGTKEELLHFMLDKFQEQGVKYAIVAKELHADQTPHFHVLVMLKNKIRIKNLDTLEFNGHHPHLEEAGNVRAWIAYCKKGNDWIDAGENPVFEQRKDRREKMLFMLDHGVQECIESGLFSICEITRRQQLVQAVRATDPLWPVFKKREIKWYYGETGTGKTRHAVNVMESLHKNNWIILGGDLRQFFNGYTGQAGVIFDDIRAGSIAFNRLLQLTDGYRCYVNVKGGFSEWMAETIIFTAPVAPQDMFKNRETNEQWDGFEQLMRRVDQLIQFPQEQPTEIVFTAPPPPGPHDIPYLPGESREQMPEPAQSASFREDESVIVGDAFLSF